MTQELISNELYRDDKIIISRSENPGEHNIVAGNSYCYFSRNILKDFSTKSTEELRQGLESLDNNFLYGLSEQKISLESLGWALSKARIIELEQEVQYFVAQYNELLIKQD